jgi:hypothetical protein
MKLNLRDFFWLIFVSAVATMWWIDRSKLADRLKFYELPPKPVAVTSPAPPLAQPGFQPYMGEDPFRMPAAAPVAPPDADPFGEPPAPPKNNAPAPAPPADPFG